MCGVWAHTWGLGRLDVAIDLGRMERRTLDGHSGKFQQDFMVKYGWGYPWRQYINLWLEQYYQAPSLSLKEGRYRLIRLWSLGLMKSLVLSLFYAFLHFHSPSTSKAKPWNRCCGSLDCSDLWCLQLPEIPRRRRKPPGPDWPQSPPVRCSIGRIHITLVPLSWKHVQAPSERVPPMLKATAVSPRLPH